MVAVHEDTLVVILDSKTSLQTTVFAWSKTCADSHDHIWEGAIRNAGVGNVIPAWPWEVDLLAEKVTFVNQDALAYALRAELGHPVAITLVR